MSKEFDDTMAFGSAAVRSDQIRALLQETKAALQERGYNAVNQITGYLIANDPAYISSYKGARSNIQAVERYEIIEELVRSYLQLDKCE